MKVEQLRTEIDGRIRTFEDALNYPELIGDVSYVKGLRDAMYMIRSRILSDEEQVRSVGMRKEMFG